MKSWYNEVTLVFWYLDFFWQKTWWPNQTEQNFIDSDLAQIKYLGEPSPENTCLQIWAHSEQPIFFIFFLADGISETEIFVDSDLAQI